MAIRNCKVNHLTNPLGFDLGRPVFSWQGEQTQYRLLIARDEALTDIVYDSGMADLDPLGTSPDFVTEPRTRYYWSVGGEVQWFETAKQEEPWQAMWIGCDRSEPRHPVFRKHIPLSGQVAQARLYICGLGLYEAEINGSRVGQERFAPFCNDYYSWVQYQTYDVTGLLDRDSLLSVTLGNGWYCGRFGLEVRETNYYGNDWKLIAELHIRYTDGREEVIGTDESWEVIRSNIIFSNHYDGEHVDATLPQLPPEKPFPAQVPQAILAARRSVPVTVHEQLPVKEILHTPAGETVLDIGQNLAGTFRIRVHIPRGQKLALQFGELLQDDCFYRDNLRSALAEYSWVSDGQPAVLEPKFTFFGYRYVKVTGADIRPEDFTALAVYSEIPAIGSLSTGHPLVNQLLHNVCWGQKGNFLDVPTDCPQRDERLGWTGDAQVFTPTACYFTDCAAFYHKYLTDMHYEQDRLEGRVPVVIPSYGATNCATAWSDAATVIPWNLYRFTGDTALLQAHYKGMRDWVDACEKLYRNGAWATRHHYGDWLALDGPYPEYDARGGTDEAFIAMAYLIHSARLTAQAAQVLGRSEDVRRYYDLAEQIKKELQQEYYAPSGRCCVNTQTAHLLTLAFDLHPNREKAIEGLKNRLNFRDGRLQTGFVGTPLLCPVLCELGMYKQAYDLLLNEELPGWLYAVKMGATTIWERWNSVLPDGKMSSTGMNSLNHYAYGSIAEWMWNWVAGLSCAEPGFRKVVIHPIPSRRLGHVDAVYASASGTYEVHWRWPENEPLTVSITVPPLCSAELTLPWAGEDVCRPGTVLEAGTYTFTYEPTGSPD